MKEIWKDIKGYEGKYQISNYGKVKSLPKQMGRGIGYTTKEKVLKYSTRIQRAKETWYKNHTKNGGKIYV